MNRKTSGDVPSFRKGPFKPIMLTSKSMKPVHRASPDKPKSIDRKESAYSNYRKPSNNSMLYANSLTKTQMVKKLTEQYRDSLIKNFQQIKISKDHTLKPLTAAIVQMEFDSEDLSTKQQNRYDELLTNLSYEGKKGEYMKKYMYCTSMKNYEKYYNSMKTRNNNTVNFSKIKIKPLHQDLDRDYLQINKFPTSDAKAAVDISPEKLQEISLKVEEYEACLIKKMENKNKPKMTPTASNPTSSPGKSPQTGGRREISLKTDLTKIEEDIQLKRVCNKKEHFVFGMSDTAKNTTQNNNRVKFEHYKDYLWKVNFSNGLYVRVKDQIECPYKLYVGPGNNSMIIKGIMRRRFWWQVVDKVADDVNFVWTQLKINDFFKLQKVANKIQIILSRTPVFVRTRKVKSSLQKKHREVQANSQEPKREETEEEETEGTRMSSPNRNKKMNEKQNLLKVEESSDLHSKVFQGKDLLLWEDHISSNWKAEEKMENYLPKRIKTLVRTKKLKFIEDSKAMKVHNHLERNYFLGNKKALFYSMRKYYTLLGKNPFANIPLTFHISNGLQDPEYSKFLDKYEEFQDRKKQKQMQNIWIVKPGELTNRGRGITVCSILDDVKVRLRSKEKSSSNQLHTYIVQKYIEKPLLYNRRKFDIRHYMLMTCVNGKMKGYWYSEGYLRTTSYEYNVKNCKDLYTHLTNDAIQKHSADYGKFQKGNKVSYADFQKYLNANYKARSGKRDADGAEDKKYDFFGTTLPQMKELAADAMKATYLLLSPTKYQHNFELFGLDFMLDEDMNLYLIEVNTNPCLETSCPLLSRLIAGLVEDTFRIAVDPLFPPPYEWPNTKKMQISDNCLQDNKFCIIFDENVEGEALTKLFEGGQNFEQAIGEIDEEDEEYEDEGKQWVED